MTKLLETKNSIVLENDCAEIEISKENALVQKIIDKKTGKDIKSKDDSFFFVLQKKNGDTIALKGLAFSNGIITVDSGEGSFDVEARAFDRYFTFEVVTEIPAEIYRANIAWIKYNYDFEDKRNTAAIGLAMTTSANPTFFPDGKSLETRCQVYPHLKSKESKYGLIIAPIADHKDILKEACLTIDKNKGLVSKVGGAWTRESRTAFSNYTIQSESSKEFIDGNIEYFKEIGVDQIDFHQGAGTVRQGDFKFMRYENGAEFKKHVSDVLEANGMTAGLHTYTHYINYGCETILSKPENLAQIKVMETFTLAEDIDESAMFIPTAESTECVSSDRGFCRTNSPFVLIDDELISFANDPHGFTVTQRGCAGSKISAHKKGAAVKHLEGHYHGLTPVLGSELFYEIARYTSKAYNEGGFKMIYFDALDGIAHHCDNKADENWYYQAEFIREVLKDCYTDPILEGADFTVGMWAARGRTGAWDPPYRGYKRWNERHAALNKTFIDRHGAPILGWYYFYPQTDMYPGNEHTKYQHTDDIEHMGAIAVKYDFSNVFNGMSKAQLARYAGLRRNIALYKKYDDLRKAQYFSEEYREKLIDCPHEVQLKEKRGKKFSFVEKDYQFAKLYDLSDEARNKGSFRNPFGAQVPFIRIEAMLSTAYNNGMNIFPLDETKELTAQKHTVSYGGEINLANNLAKVVRVFGNGKGGKICIQAFCATNSEEGYGEYIIDTDFKGWREFILLESDNGERRDHGFEKGFGNYAIFRSGLNNDRITEMKIATEGDMTGVRMSSIIAYEHTYEVLKNPTVKVGDMAVMFECELMSSDFIEFDGKSAKVVDRYGNEKPIWFTSNLKAPRGRFKAELVARPLNRGKARAKLTFGFTGKEIK